MWFLCPQFPHGADIPNDAKRKNSRNQVKEKESSKITQINSHKRGYTTSDDNSSTANNSGNTNKVNTTQIEKEQKELRKDINTFLKNLSGLKNSPQSNNIEADAWEASEHQY